MKNITLFSVVVMFGVPLSLYSEITSRTWPYCSPESSIGKDWISIGISEQNIVNINGVVYSKEDRAPYTGSYTSYYKNGNIRLVGRYINGLREGEFIGKSEKCGGQIIFGVTYKEGIIDGSCTNLICGEYGCALENCNCIGDKKELCQAVKF